MKFHVLAVLLAAAAPLAAQTPTPIDSVQVAGGLTRPIWYGQAPVYDTRNFAVEQKLCNIWIFKNGVKQSPAFLNITSKIISSGNERGLLGLAFDPDYQNNHFFYVQYNRVGDGATIVERYTAIDADNADPNSGLVIVGPISDPQNNHNGGNIAFGPDGKLYLGLGDGGSENDTGTGHPSEGLGQNHATMWAKMHRINSDGTIPGDNPFLSDASFPPSTWDWGMRNPWRWSFDKETGDLWIGDVGQDQHEEIDFELAGDGGRNYGWRCMEGFSCTGLSGCTCNAAGLTLPVFDYPHSGGKCSITGGFMYRGQALPDWNGTYWYGDYCTGQVWSLVYNGVVATVTERTAALDTGDGGPKLTSLTSFGQDNTGELYLVFQGGLIRQIIPAGPFKGLGNALAGVSGKPVLWGEGPLTTGSAGALDFKNVAPSAVGQLFVSLAPGAAPFKGGVLVAVPIVVSLPIFSDGTGAAQLAWASWPTVPSATTIVFQAGFSDPAAIKGVSLTNALQALTP